MTSCKSTAHLLFLTRPSKFFLVVLGVEMAELVEGTGERWEDLRRPITDSKSLRIKSSSSNSPRT